MNKRDSLYIFYNGLKIDQLFHFVYLHYFVSTYIRCIVLLAKLFTSSTVTCSTIKEDIIQNKHKCKLKANACFLSAATEQLCHQVGQWLSFLTSEHVGHLFKRTDFIFKFVVPEIKTTVSYKILNFRLFP